MADLQLTHDGDLVIGLQEINPQGNLLYYMGNKPEIIGEMTDTPEEDSYPITDAATVDHIDYDMQLIQSILRTDNPDWQLYPEIGADMSELAGELNTQKTALRGQRKIEETIRKTDYVEDREFSVEPIPISAKEVLYTVALEDFEHVSYEHHFILDLEIGVLNYYELEGEMYK